MIEELHPLISVVVITYNSAEFVEETLNSAYAQSYPNIELIVSDDCSSDSTVSIVNKWVEEHSERFKAVKVIAVEKNGGIAANCNRGFKEAKGEWIKIIAGDDLLDTQCIQHYVDELPMLPNGTALIHGLVQKFSFNNGANTSSDIWPVDTATNIFYSNKLSTKEILDIMIDGNRIAAPSILYRRAAVEKVGGFNEQYPFMEDYPLHIALLRQGYGIWFTNNITAHYRVSDSSISHRNSQRIYSTLYLDTYYRFIFEKICPLSSRANKLRHKVKFVTYRLVVTAGGNKHNVFTFCVLKLSILITRIIDRIKK